MPAAPPNPYQRSFKLFLRECVFTIDKAMAGLVRGWPRSDHWDNYFDDWETALLCCSPLLIDKTRRTMASNVTCAFDLWLASGGIDPRWPILVESTQNRSVLIQAQKLGQSKADEGCSAEFVTRIETMYGVMLEHGLRDRWPGFPEWRWGFGWGVATNGGKILAVPEGPGQVRGPGTTFLHMEELGEWSQAQATCSVAIPALFPHGHVIAITTPAIDTYAERIMLGKVATGAGGALPPPPPTKCLPLVVAGDWYRLEIRGERDIPGYKPSEVGRGMSPQDYRRDVLGDWTASSGKVVYPEYGDVHEPHQPLPYDPERPLICGWDLPASTGGTPAFVPTQLSAAGQWCIYAPLGGDDDTEDAEVCGVWEYGERVAEYLSREFAEPYGLSLHDLELIHYGDPAGNAKPVAGASSSSVKLELRSAFEILRQGETVVLGHDAQGKAITEVRPGRGWNIQPGEVAIAKGVEAVRGRLTTLLSGGAPALVVDVNATAIRKGFRGGYNFPQRADGRYELDPGKNKYSHPFDALRYIASRLFVARGRREPDEDTRPRNRGVRAPGRPRR